MDLEEVLNIFYSNFSKGVDYEALEEILALIEEQLLNCRKIRLISKIKFNRVIQQIIDKKIDTFDLEGGTKAHIALKKVAGDYLRKLNKKPLYERWFQGRLVDVISSDFSIIIECGNTDPRKILEYLEKESLSLLGILPYPDPEEKDLCLYIFSPRKGLNDYLNSLSKRKTDAIKRIIQSKNFR